MSTSFFSRVNENPPTANPITPTTINRIPTTVAAFKLESPSSGRTCAGLDAESAALQAPAAGVCLHSRREYKQTAAPRLFAGLWICKCASGVLFLSSGKAHRPRFQWLPLFGHASGQRSLQHQKGRRRNLDIRVLFHVCNRLPERIREPLFSVSQSRHTCLDAEFALPPRPVRLSIFRRENAQYHPSGRSLLDRRNYGRSGQRGIGPSVQAWKRPYPGGMRRASAPHGELSIYNLSHSWGSPHLDVKACARLKSRKPLIPNAFHACPGLQGITPRSGRIEIARNQPRVQLTGPEPETSRFSSLPPQSAAEANKSPRRTDCGSPAFPRGKSPGKGFHYWASSPRTTSWLSSRRAFLYSSSSASYR